MARAPFQILILPFRQAEGRPEYAVFSRADDECWQGIAGGGEDDETPLEAARREALEEAGVPPAARFVELQTRSSVPVTCFRESAGWGEELYVVTEHCYGVEMQSGDIQLSGEHRAYRWVDYDTALKLLTYDGNKTALWELNQRLLGLGPRDGPSKPLPEGPPAR
jgi:dATP pyrophosphohydrolase